MNRKKYNLKLCFIIATMVSILCINIIKTEKSPKVALLKGEKNRVVTKEESPIGYMYYDDTLKMVVAEFGVDVINRDNIPHKVAFKIDSSKYRDSNYIKSDFVILKTYEEVIYLEGKDYSAGNEIVLGANEEKNVRFYATAKYGGSGERSRSGPPVEIKVLE